ncbi:hypothetical protein ACFE04_008494 [Oxalis oulophora]
MRQTVPSKSNGVLGIKIIHVKWAQTVPSKSNGGLCIGSILERNKALLFKWFWKLCSNEENEWRNIVRDKYMDQSLATLAPVINSRPQSSVFKGIYSISLKSGNTSSLLINGFSIPLGDGSKISFWLDKWAGDRWLKEKYSRLYALSTQRNMSVLNMGEWTVNGLIFVANVSSQFHDYCDALSKCILFFEGQRSGKLPSSQRLTWRKDSALRDGFDVGMNLVGGYYDAGDNVKFNFPMAFSTTLLAWGVIEYGQFMGPDLPHALDAVRWGADYFLRATSEPGQVVASVGDPVGDHDCWERPEDMDTPRTTYVVNQTHPGSELSAEIAAALASSSLALNKINPTFSKVLVERAKQVFEFADKYRGSYDSSVYNGVCPFYCDYNGYMDELVWGAAWLYKATNEKQYFDYVKNNIQEIENYMLEKKLLLDSQENDGGGYAEFGWDSKHAGINVLVSSWALQSRDRDPFARLADALVCSILPESPTKFVTYSPGGLMFKPGSSNMQHTTALSFLLLTYSRYLEAANVRSVQCGTVTISTARLVEFVKGQVDYVLGSNPLKMSYMVGYSQRYPGKLHHRGATLPSKDAHLAPLKCRDGDSYFKSNGSDLNQLTGALAGGPDENDQFGDSRYNVSQTEPTTYINAPFVGLLAFFKKST